MSKAKGIMHWGAECVAASDTLETAVPASLAVT
jgi:hypothetical protein